MRDSPTDFTHRSYGAFKGVHLSPLGFAACQSKKFTNTTKSIFSHRIQNRTFLLGILPQISQIYTDIFAEKTPTDFTEHTELSCWDILPQISQNTQNFLAEIFSHRFHRFTQNFLAGKNSVKSVDSVGDIHALTSVRICEICGSFFNYKLRVDSVGDIRALTSVRICEICGSFFNYKLRAVSQGPEHEKINLFLLICSPTDFSF